MRKNKQIGIPFLAMAGSLLLLCVFVFLWLQRVYLDEYRNLQREVDFLFINSIRDFEDELFRNAGDKPVILQLSDTFGLSEIETTGRVITLIDSIFISDSSLLKIEETRRPHLQKGDMVTTIWMTDSMKCSDSNNIRIEVKTNKGIPEGKFDGSLSLYIKTNKKEGTFPFSDSINIESLIGARFTQAIQSTNIKLPPKYKIEAQISHSFPYGRLVSKKYTDIFTGESFAVEFFDYPIFILKKMWAAIGFALLLLFSISLSFLLIYKSLQKQQRLTALKNDFISNITHELKTPITTVGVAIEALRDFDAQNNPDRLNEYLDISKYELNRLSLLVDKVLKMSLFEKRAPVLHKEEIDVEEVIQSVLNAMKLQFEKQEANTNFEINGDNFIIKADRVHLTNVIYNLVENALKYSTDNPQIDILLVKNGDKVQLSISDKGIGIPTQYLKKVFDKFFRVPTGNKHNVKGHGLGLTYVAGVIQQHGGTIEVVNRTGGGVCFKLNL